MSAAVGPPSARAIAALIRAGEVSAREVVDAHLARIAERNPSLGALTVVFAERARAAAADVDRAAAAGEPLGVLAGVPFSVKENIDLTWSATTHGWGPAADAVPAADATVVRRLREAGGIPIGRGNMPDFGMRWDTDNDLFGRTLNPWDATRTVGGSSGGDAVAVATGMSTLGLGNDFGGSLRIPAFATGVSGLKPSAGRVPRAAVGADPVSLTLQQWSVTGPLARRVDDLALALDVLSGPDPADPVSLPLADVGEGLPRRVAVVRPPTASEADEAVLARAARALSGAGWEVVDAEPPHLEEAAVLWRRLACTDMLLALDPAVLGAELGRSAAQFLRDSTAAAEPYVDAADYAAAWARRIVITAAWRRFQIETPILLGPVLTGGLPAIDYDLADPAAGRSGEDAATGAWVRLWLTVTANFLGLPAVAVPAGAGDAIPSGVQLIGPAHGDRFALAAARDLERAQDEMAHWREGIPNSRR